MIKVISFDIGGTLVLNNEKDEYTLKRLAEVVGLNYNLVRDAYKDIFQKQKGTFKELETLFCQRLQIELTDELDIFFKNKFKKNNTSKEINKEFLEVSSSLKEKGYRIILFSNSCCLMDNDLDGKILSNVDYVFYSFDLGYTKNEAESYRIIEKELGCSSNEFLHIGDTLTSDYLEPQKYGWNALYYGVSKEKGINSITSLKKILRKI